MLENWLTLSSHNQAACPEGMCRLLFLHKRYIKKYQRICPHWSDLAPRQQHPLQQQVRVRSAALNDRQLTR